MRDYYAILGVLPLAEDVVIRAAYKALAQRYHPDRYQGVPNEAHKRMSEINEAYAVLSDAAKRREYDLQRDAQGGGSYEYDTAYNPESDPLEEALKAYDTDWAVACKFHAGIDSTFNRLWRTNKLLGLSFKMIILETKEYKNHSAIGESMENYFLRKYFGGSEKILVFAKELISSGNKAAAATLNKYVAVLGDSVAPDQLVQRVRKEHNVPDPWVVAKQRATEEAERKRREREALEEKQREIVEERLKEQQKEYEQAKVRANLARIEREGIIASNKKPTIATPNALMASDYTVSHFLNSVRRSDFEQVDAILEDYPDIINRTNSDGQTALDIAHKEKHIELADHLVAKGARGGEAKEEIKYAAGLSKPMPILKYVLGILLVLTVINQWFLLLLIPAIIILLVS